MLTAKFPLALDRIGIPITALAYMACLEGYSSLNGSNSAWDVAQIKLSIREQLFPASAWRVVNPLGNS